MRASKLRDPDAPHLRHQVLTKWPGCWRRRRSRGYAGANIARRVLSHGVIRTPIGCRRVRQRLEHLPSLPRVQNLDAGKPFHERRRVHFGNPS
jgi:hypothetical protein